jgi:drug/metabolite transporter (DMT)-like permease
VSHYLGELFALLAAITWAVALVLFKRSGETVSPLAMSMFKNVVACLCLGATLLVLEVFPQVLPAGDGAVPLGRVRDLPATDIGILLLSGILGIAIADTLLFYALDLIGVGLVTVAECTYTPFVMLFAWMLLDEGVESSDVVGAGMVLAGVLISSTHAPPADRTRRQLLLGSLLCVAAIGLMAVGIVWAKPIIERTSLLPTTMMRLIGGTVIMTLMIAVSRRRAAFFAVLKPSRAWRTMVPASVLGTYLAMIFWVGGFKYTKASIAAVLNQTSTIFALIMATLILKEPFTKRKMTAAVLAFAGVAVVTLA